MSTTDAVVVVRLLLRVPLLARLISSSGCKWTCMSASGGKNLTSNLSNVKSAITSSAREEVEEAEGAQALPKLVKRQVNFGVNAMVDGCRLRSTIWFWCRYSIACAI